MKKKQYKQKKKRKGLLFKTIAGIVSLFYGKVNIEGLDNIPDEPCVIVGNHAQMHGPVSAELKTPFRRYTWCIGNMLHIREFPKYAYKEFWGNKPKCIRWLFKIFAYMITPLAVYVFRNADVIGVYKDGRAMSTFKHSLRALEGGYNIVLFPECHKPHNNIINEFEEGFASLGRLYHRYLGKDLTFVPMYNAPDLKTIVYGKPIRYSECNRNSKKLAEYLKNEITRLATNLPLHRVVPYDNIPKKKYPISKQFKRAF